MTDRRSSTAIDVHRWQRVPLAWSILWLLLAAPLAAQVTLTIHHARVPAGDSTAVVPVALANEQDEVGGLQLDLRQAAGSPALDTIYTTDRTSGWTVSRSHDRHTAVTRLLLFDPKGSNIAPGSGPVMELVYAWPADSAYSAYLPLEVAALSVSDALGDELLSVGRSGSLGIGALAAVALDTVVADAGDTVEVAVTLAGNVPIAEVHLDLVWQGRWLTMLNHSPTTRGSVLAKSPGQANGAALRLLAADSNRFETGQVTIATLKFAVSQEALAGDIPLTITAARFLLADGREAALTSIGPGLITVYPGYLAPPTELTALSREDGRVPLIWRAPGITGPRLGAPSGYAIYRGREPDFALDTLSRIAQAGAGTISFNDTTVVNGETYYYRVAAVYADSLESAAASPVAATPQAPAVLAIPSILGMAGQPVEIPITLENTQPVAGLRFTLEFEPDISLTAPKAILGARVPPSWIVTLSPDTVGSSLHIVALSPQLTAIPPGKGEVLRLGAAIPVDGPLKAALRLRDVVISAPDGEAYPTRVIDNQLAIEVQVADLRIGTGPPIQPGDTGTITIFMDNPEPVLAFRLVVKAAGDALQVIRVDGMPRLPSDADVAFTNLGAGAVQIIASSFSQNAIAAGAGAIVALTYQVANTAAEGLVKLVLDEVALTDRRGRTLRQATVAGHFPVGSIKAVFTPGISDGQPGRTVTVPLNLANRVALCGFQFEVQHDPHMLEFLSLEGAGRLPGDHGLRVHKIEPGRLQVEYDGPQPIAGGDGSLLSLVFALAGSVPWDTSLAIVVSRVDADGCPAGPVFALGQAGRVIIGAAPARPVHFLTDMEPAGGIHFITAQAITLGGRYLDQGDEVAVIDTSIGGEGTSVIVMGVGVVREDGSVDIPARLGFAAGRGLPAGAESGLGRAMVFLAWDRQADEESRPGTEARYVLGAGLWGENNGLTIIDLLQLPAVAKAPLSPSPDQLVVEQNVPNPFTDTTVIRFGLPAEQQVRVAVYDLLGRELLALHDGITAAGYHQVTWDGTDGNGRPARKGMWFYQVRIPGRTITRKMLLMR